MANLPNRTLRGEELATENGVEYLLNKLRPHFLEGKTNILLFSDEDILDATSR